MQIKARGKVYSVHPVPLYRRRERGSRPYSRPTDWIVQAGKNPVVWGRTRQEALTALKRQLGLHLRVVGGR